MVRVTGRLGPGRWFGEGGRGAGEIVPFHSRLLERNPWGDPATRDLGVYLPPGRVVEGRPLLLLLPGFTGSGWAEALPERFLGESLFRLFDRLVRTGTCPPAVIVAPDGLTRLGGSQYVNSSATGRYADHIVREIVPWARATYGTGPVGVLGQSSGGFGALHLAMEFPGTFQAAGSSAGDMCFEYTFPADLARAARTLPRSGGAEKFLRRLAADPSRLGDPSDAVSATLLVLAMSSCYSPRPGAPGDFDLPFDERTGELLPKVWARWLRFDPIRRLRTLSARRALRRLRRLTLTAASRDEWFLDVGARLFVDRARRARVPVEYREFEGGHFDKGPRFGYLFERLTRALSAAP